MEEIMKIKLGFDCIDEKEQFCEKHNFTYISHHFMRLDGSACWTTCEICSREIEREKQYQADLVRKVEDKKNLIAKLFKQAVIPPRFQSNTFESYIATSEEQQKAKSTLMEFSNNIKSNLKLGRNIILAGNPGTGKTHLSVSIAKMAINHSFTALFTTVGDMLDKINEAAGWDKAKVINNYGIPDLLILDEVTSGFNNEEQKNVFKVINRRYEHIKSTIIQTNLDIDELKKVLGERIIDRLRENGGTILYFAWESHRKQLKGNSTCNV
jgi:DNA replication protein DnaC